MTCTVMSKALMHKYTCDCIKWSSCVPAITKKKILYQFIYLIVLYAFEKKNVKLENEIFEWVGTYVLILARLIWSHDICIERKRNGGNRDVLIFEGFYFLRWWDKIVLLKNNWYWYVMCNVVIQVFSPNINFYKDLWL